MDANDPISPVVARKRGRPPGRTKDRRTHRLTIRLRPDELALIVAASRRTGENAALWARRLLLRLSGDDKRSDQLSLPVEFKRAAGHR